MPDVPDVSHESRHAAVRAGLQLSGYTRMADLGVKLVDFDVEELRDRSWAKPKTENLP